MVATILANRIPPNWFAQSFDATGKRVSKSTGTAKKREADRIAAGFETEKTFDWARSSGYPSGRSDHGIVIILERAFEAGKEEQISRYIGNLPEGEEKDRFLKVLSSYQ